MDAVIENLGIDLIREHGDVTLRALEKLSARTAIKAAASLARAGDIDHLGGGLELIPALQMTLACVDYDRTHFTIEHGHTSIGYYGVLTTLGFLDEARVVDGFRRSLDIAGHVSWIPGGSPIGSGRLGITVPATAGWALGLKAAHGADSFVICHCGDAGWVSGQALNGLITASLHKAPMTLVVMPEECQSMPMTQPNDWNQNGCARRRSSSSRP